MNEPRYTYLGTHGTDAALREAACTVVRHANGKRAWHRGKALVDFGGRLVVVVARRLRRADQETD